MWFAERWGWPPSVVDAQPIGILQQLPHLATAWDEAHTTLTREAQAKAQAAAAKGR